MGKSSLVLRFVKGQFHEYQESTIGGTSARGSTNTHLPLVAEQSKSPTELSAGIEASY